MFEVGESVEIVAKPGLSLAYDTSNASLCPGPAVVVATAGDRVEISFPGTCNQNRVVCEHTLKHCYGYAVVEWVSKNSYTVRAVQPTRESAETSLKTWLRNKNENKLRIRD